MTRKRPPTVNPREGVSPRNCVPKASSIAPPSSRNVSLLSGPLWHTRHGRVSLLLLLPLVLISRPMLGRIPFLPEQEVISNTTRLEPLLQRSNSMSSPRRDPSPPIRHPLRLRTESQSCHRHRPSCWRLRDWSWFTFSRRNSCVIRKGNSQQTAHGNTNLLLSRTFPSTCVSISSRTLLVLLVFWVQRLLVNLLFVSLFLFALRQRTPSLLLVLMLTTHLVSHLLNLALLINSNNLVSSIPLNSPSDSSLPFFIKAQLGGFFLPIFQSISGQEGMDCRGEEMR